MDGCDECARRQFSWRRFFVEWQGLPMGGKNDLATSPDSATAQALTACLGWYGLCLE